MNKLQKKTIEHYDRIIAFAKTRPVKEKFDISGGGEYLLRG